MVLFTLCKSFVEKGANLIFYDVIANQEYVEYRTTTKLKQSTLWWRLKLIMTQFYRIKGEVGVSPSPPSPITFETVDEIL